MTPEKQNVEAGGEEREPVPAKSAPCDVLEVGWDEEEFREERAGVIHRTGQRLGRMLEELKKMEADLDRLDLTLQLPGLSERQQREIQSEIDLAVDAYNYLREAAACSFRQLIRQREAFGFRGHELIHRCYPIPDLLLPPDSLDDIVEDRT